MVCSQGLCISYPKGNVYWNAKAPEQYKDAILVFFTNTFLRIKLENTAKRVKVLVQGGFQNNVPQVMSALLEILDIICKDIFEEEFKGHLILQGDDEDQGLCKYDELRRAKGNASHKVFCCNADEIKYIKVFFG